MDDRIRAQQLSAELKLPLAESQRFDAIPSAVVGLLPEATLAALRVVPLAIEGQAVIIACAEPEHFRYMKELSGYLKRPVRPVLATRRDIARTLLRLYRLAVPPGWLPPGEPLQVDSQVQVGAPSTAEHRQDEDEPPDDDATIPMTQDEVRRALNAYAAQKQAARDRGASPGQSGPAAPAGQPGPPAPAVISSVPLTSSQFSNDPTVALAVDRQALLQPPPPAAPQVVAPPLAVNTNTPAGRVTEPRPPVRPEPQAPAGRAIQPVAETRRQAPIRGEPRSLADSSGRVAAAQVPGRPPGRGRFRERYKLVRRLAVGGMAEVYLARVQGAEGFEREVVVKKILPCYVEDNNFVEMFIDEAKIACRLNHPNIAQVYELSIEEDEYFMAMEYIEGRDLLALMEHCRRRGTRLPPTITAFILCSVLEALEHAHNKRDEDGRPLGIIHRDVTPSNVLISYDGHVKIIDFGIAKAREKMNVTRVGFMKGKPGYLAPEQAKGEPLDRRVDVFAAGILLYELLSNKRLFSDSARASVMARLVTFRIEPEIRFNFKIPWSLRSVLRRALALYPQDRFESAAKMAEPLAQYLRKKAARDPRQELRGLLRKFFPQHARGEGPTT